MTTEAEGMPSTSLPFSSGEGFQSSSRMSSPFW